MNENAIIAGSCGIAAARGIIATGVSKLSGKGVVVVAGIIGLTIVGSVIAVCSSGSELSISNGLLEIRQPT